MTDTPEHIKALQLKIWLSKPPMERLRQMMIDNEAQFKFWMKVKATTELGIAEGKIPNDKNGNKIMFKK